MVNISQLLKDLIQLPVSLSLAASYKTEGYIVDVKGDYIHFEDKHKVPMYIPLSSIKTIKRNSKMLKIQPYNVSHVKYTHFKDLLKSMKQIWLYVKVANSEYLEGVLGSIYDEYALFVQDETILIIPLSDIVSVQEFKDVEEDMNMNLEQQDQQVTEVEQKVEVSDEAVESVTMDAMEAAVFEEKENQTKLIKLEDIQDNLSNDTAVIETENEERNVPETKVTVSNEEVNEKVIEFQPAEIPQLEILKEKEENELILDEDPKEIAAEHNDSNNTAVMETENEESNVPETIDIVFNEEVNEKVIKFQPAANPQMEILKENEEVELTLVEDPKEIVVEDNHFNNATIIETENKESNVPYEEVSRSAVRYRSTKSSRFQNPTEEIDIKRIHEVKPKQAVYYINNPETCLLYIVCSIFI